MKINSIKETCIYVQDLDRTEEFYSGKLGFPVIVKIAKKHVFFRAGGSVLLCFIAGSTSGDTRLPAHGSVGSIHLAFEVNKDVYEASKEEVVKAGIEILHEEDWGKGDHSFYFRDPDNHLLEIVQKGLWDS